MWEGSREYGRAIDAYLSVTLSPSADAATCASAWQQAVQLAVRHDKARYPEIAEEVAHRFVEVGRLEAAGDLFLDVEQVDKAADCYVQAQLWTKAKEAVKGGPQKLRDAVDAAYKSHLLKAGDPAQMAAAGAVEAAIQAYAAQGSYDKVFELASKTSASSLAGYIYPYAERLLGSGQPVEVVALLSKYGAPPSASQLPFYRRLVAELLALPATFAGAGKVVADLRDVLYKVVAGLRKQAAPGSGDALGEYERLLLVVHSVAMRGKLSEMGLAELAARVSVGMLRFAGTYIPADRAFYEAGAACKGVGWKSMALVLLNRFIDICDAMEEGARDLSGLDNADFAGAGVPSPAEMAMPAAPFVAERAKEEVKEWVLTVSMDRKVEQTLSKRPCFACSTPIFEAALGCPSCKAGFPSCVITGYPIPSSQLATCAGCGSKALKSAWNAVVGKTKACPWCAAGASMIM